MRGRLGYGRIGREGGRKKDQVARQANEEGGGVALGSHSPPAWAWLEILPLAQAWEQAQSLGFALGGCSVLESHSSVARNDLSVFGGPSMMNLPSCTGHFRMLCKDAEKQW